MTDKQLFTHVLGWLDERECPELYAAVRERLGKPEQEPVASCIRSLTDHCASLVRERDEMQKQVWRYEKHGVTCQTYGHKVDSSCAECNVHENYAAPPAAPVQEVDWKDQYEKQKRHAEMWIAKYEKDIGPIEYAAPAAQRQPPQFPTMLRKMWSGAEVQKWINENWSKS